jgi:glycine betaine transporter
VFFTDNLAAVASAVLGWLIASFGWVFILASFGFLVFVLFLALSRYGRIKLGKDDDEPEFRTASWVAMMFSAGIGDRPDVLRGCGAHLAPHRSPARSGEGRY